ncbi:MAG: potassium channel family protein, partial [Actinobacteria bacterium]|nr:potassium channel family protein [Actinomycetota bacterium]
MEQSHQPFYKRVIVSIIVLVSIYILGFIGYVLIEKMSFLDAIFMTTITITTVGYGVVKELSTAGTIFTIVLIIIGTGSAAYILISLADFMLNEFLAGRAQDRRVRKMISKLKNHIILCGYGTTGRYIARELYKTKN